MGKGKDERITSRPYGKVQAVRSGRKVFGRERQRVFLEQLAATCNVQRSAEVAGVTTQCVYQRRARDAAFREAWGVTLEQGYARLELRLLEAAMGERPLHHPADGPPPRSGEDLAEEPLDKELALHLLREHKRGGTGRKDGAAPPLRSASWDEVAAYFMARLKALRVRIDGEGEDPSTIRSSADGSPPRGELGEEFP